MPEIASRPRARRSTATSRATPRCSSRSDCAAAAARHRRATWWRALGDGEGLVARLEVAGPGFVNVWLAEDRWQDSCDVIEARARFGRATGRRPKGPGGVRLRESHRSADPGPRPPGGARRLHRAPVRGTGWDVTREYYFNNGGRQMRVLGESVKRAHTSRRWVAPRRRLPKPLEDPRTLGRDGRRWLPVAFSPRTATRATTSSRSPQTLRERRTATPRGRAGEAAASAKPPRRDLRGDPRHPRIDLGIELRRLLQREVALRRGQARRGARRPARGRPRLRGGRRGLAPRDRARPRARPRAGEEHGEPTYLLPDIAYHREKFRRGFEKMIDVQGADHIEQFPYVRDGRHGRARLRRPTASSW